jgi:hypothetical protein
MSDDLIDEPFLISAHSEVGAYEDDTGAVMVAGHVSIPIDTITTQCTWPESYKPLSRSHILTLGSPPFVKISNPSHPT